MKTYAEVLNGIVQCVGTCKDDFTPEFAPPLKCVIVDAMTGTPAEGDSWDGTMFHPKDTSAKDRQEHQARARAALTASDVTVLRCMEQGITLPEDWKNYRSALRSVVSSGEGLIPNHPEWPTAPVTPPEPIGDPLPGFCPENI